MLCLSLVLSLTACGGKSAAGRTESGSPSVSDVLEAGMTQEDGDREQGSPAEETGETGQTGSAPSVTDETVPAEETVDVDLTAMSSTMVYSEVVSMLTDPDPFMGKMVRMAGQFAIYEDTSTGNIYFACIVQDATACCANGIEFVLEGEPQYPEGYPELGEEITVTGTFDTYEENGYYYVTLRKAHLS